MILKASAAVLGSAAQSHSLFAVSAACIPRPTPPTTPSWSPTSSSLRRYATTGSGSPNGSSSQHEWPKSPTPSPYEIFGQDRHAPYSKAKFYELVKIYHPDTHRQASSGSSVSESVRLERYRLVVAANNILSDPVKRQSYDRYGLGWDGPSGFDPAGRPGHASSQHRRSWREEPGNASMNATWEDWERWYAERDGRAYAKQQPVYMPNGMFVFVLCLLVLAGSAGQARRANASTMNLVEMRDQNHTAISDEMRRRQNEQAVLNRHERVEHFLRQREGWRLVEADAHHHQHHGHHAESKDK